MRCGTLSHDSVCDINPLKFRTGQKEMKPFFSKVCHTHRIHKMRNNDRTTLWVPFLFHHYPPEWHLICPNTSLTSWTTYSSIPGHFEFHRKWKWSNLTKNRLKRITYALVCTCPQSIAFKAVKGKVDHFQCIQSKRKPYVSMKRSFQKLISFEPNMISKKYSASQVLLFSHWRRSFYFEKREGDIHFVLWPCDIQICISPLC